VGVGVGGSSQEAAAGSPDFLAMLAATLERDYGWDFALCMIDVGCPK
jgi:hypothetical protein